MLHLIILLKNGNIKFLAFLDSYGTKATSWFIRIKNIVPSQSYDLSKLGSRLTSVFTIASPEK